MVRYVDDAGQAFVLSKDAEQRSKVLTESAQGAEDSSQQMVQLPFDRVCWNHGTRDTATQSCYSCL